jgi:hypothetical protein
VTRLGLDCNDSRTALALTSHKAPGVNSGHAQSADSKEDSVEPINSARTNRHGEAALTANVSQTFISNASEALAKTNEDCCSEADNTALDTKIKDSIKEINESFTNSRYYSRQTRSAPYTVQRDSNNILQKKQNTVKSSR